ncbi:MULTISPECIES: hydantoinase/carbamoylase family amidase [unclassified Shinella]|uniref:hydantoinase/carbamoylase family amidase n=1 Tax=unclassified Shinella TaxID=2643062 RepID=UPI0003C52FEC|nr:MULTISPECIES: hydantoinase/carbamoylase family amidase [unclassified Shinella]EYR79428.1 allantoate amidohydrolase AllC [Shinella sp. DD12]
MPAIIIKPDRLLADLHRLRTFGAYKTGVHRPTYSAEDMAARRWLVARMQEAGLSSRMDGIGNIVGENTAARRRLLVGSHSDSQNHAGWLDGAMGVIYGLEIARAFVEAGTPGGAGVDAAVFADEEAHFASFLGSRSAIGALDEDEIDSARNLTTGETLREALSGAGLADLDRRAIDPSQYLGYLEAHIEQGDDLEARGLKLGVVTCIVGIHQYRVRFSGASNHAGTTRMAIRRDAGAALVSFAHAINERFRQLAAERTVWTVGNIRLEPGQVSIIPNHAEMLLQVRDADPAVLARMRAALEDLVAFTRQTGPCEVELELLAESEPHEMNSNFQDTLESVASRMAPRQWQRMPSGAGHDAQILARIMPAGMLFVPSIGGVSHHVDEDTREDDIVLGCEVLAAGCCQILETNGEAT